MVKGAVIVVGAGPGLGLAIARVFAKAGHPVALIARRKERLEALVGDLVSYGIPALAYQADASEPGSLRVAITAAIADLGAPASLVYNAALLRRDSPTDGDDGGWVTAMAVDVLGAKVAAETVLPLLEGERQSLLFTGGALATRPSPSFASLSVGKAALRAYVQALSVELADSPVHAAIVTIDGRVDGGLAQLSSAAIAKAYLQLHEAEPVARVNEVIVR
ncbi:SDR family NAD(P)-dependent oxidoreductase [Demequina rhizosphaerae]|uniref:SDR family NAD(P)-dependent oxidoreductase n=1 Tax=Demequina rhizosphaerae TaxID=1638985 RepID=UPI000A07CC8A|nr:SDR family NAD(P)-dependent oxidoreductase [Demequina rhizosphaerae]